MANLRLKIEMKKKGFKIPISYQSILQGLIYNTFQQQELGDFYHNRGYTLDEKVFKMFVFSNLYGDYTIENKELCFNERFRFYLSSYDERFIESFYNFLTINSKVILNNQIVDIVNVEMVDLPYYSGIKTIKIKTISPVVAYKTIDKYVQYFKPSDAEFEQLIFNNLIRKDKAYQSHINEIKFKIKEIKFEKERIVKFKNTFYKAYMFMMDIETNYDTLKLLYDTGMSAKGSSGFGMINVIR